MSHSTQPLVLDGSGSRIPDDALTDISDLYTLEGFEATQIVNNQDAVSHIGNWIVVTDAHVEFAERGDTSEVLTDHLDLAPNIDVNVYERNHATFEYFITMAVDGTVYRGVTFSGNLLGMIAVLLEQCDTALGGVKQLHSIHIKPSYPTVQSFLDDINAVVGEMSMAEAIAEIQS